MIVKDGYHIYTYSSIFKHMQLCKNETFLKRHHTKRKLVSK